MKKQYLVLFSMLMISIILSDCTRDETKGGPVPLNITIDSSKIGACITDSAFAISFNPPFLWEDYNTELSERVESVKGNNKSLKKKFAISPKYLFFKYGSNSLLSVGEITSLDSTIRHGERISDYIKIILEKNDSTKVFIQDYLKDGLLIHHVKTEVENLISWKYIFNSGDDKIIQFDYTFRKQDEEKQKEAVLSSLATIRTK